MFLLVSHYPDFLITCCIHAFENHVQHIVLYGLSNAEVISYIYHISFMLHAPSCDWSNKNFRKFIHFRVPITFKCALFWKNTIFICFFPTFSPRCIETPGEPDSNPTCNIWRHRSQFISYGWNITLYWNSELHSIQGSTLSKICII